MPFVTSVERIGMEKGLKKGREEGRQEGQQETFIEAIAIDVAAKFPTEAAELMRMVQEVNGVDALRAALRAVKNVQTPDEFRAVLSSFANANRAT